MWAKRPQLMLGRGSEAGPEGGREVPISRTLIPGGYRGAGDAHGGWGAHRVPGEGGARVALRPLEDASQAAAEQQAELLREEDPGDLGEGALGLAAQVQQGGPQEGDAQAEAEEDAPVGQRGLQVPLEERRHPGIPPPHSRLGLPPRGSRSPACLPAPSESQRVRRMGRPLVTCTPAPRLFRAPSACPEEPGASGEVGVGERARAGAPASRGGASEEVPFLCTGRVRRKWRAAPAGLPGPPPWASPRLLARPSPAAAALLLLLRPGSESLARSSSSRM